MSPLPEEMVDRWQRRREDGPEEGTVYWHILLGDNPDLCAAVKSAHGRLAEFPGLHMTPLQWLHITTLVAGSDDSITDEHMTEMLMRASSLLSDTSPIDVTLSRVLYHPEAVVLDVHPRDALGPLRSAALIATRTVIRRKIVDTKCNRSWMPHVTICYSTGRQAADPIISALGFKLPATEIKIESLSLVVQRGPERLWDWHTVGTIQLSDGPRGRH